MSDHRHAEVISLDDRRRGISAAEAELRERCREPRADGSPCRLYLDANGMCRVCQPERSEPTPPTPLAPELPTFDDAALDDLERAVRGVLAFVRRRLTGDFVVDDYGFDRELTEQVIHPLSRPLYQRWWRVRTVGIGHVPDEGGALLVANHAGAIPFDAVMTKLAVYDEHPAHRHVRELAADLALRVPVIGPLARKTGNTLAHTDDAVSLLTGGELVGVWPEGFKGIGKPYRDRYKLQRFGRGGFVEVAIRAGVPIVPVATIGSEEIYPIVANLKPLARLLGFPYFPITWQFPLLGPLGIIPLPSKWVIEFGEPIHTEHLGPDAADDPMLVFEITDRVRDTIQQMIYRNLMGRRSIFF
ncbi:lysophospholipid acyltransferase family protein [Euzebya sp.]|uniref:lysophospholipid acyltransferase family protein n=1 Tax=Euzebya sp. TaxID=1971409 RepID=UPI0035136308